MLTGWTANVAVVNLAESRLIDPSADMPLNRFGIKFPDRNLPDRLEKRFLRLKILRLTGMAVCVDEPGDQLPSLQRKRFGDAVRRVLEVVPFRYNHFFPFRFRQVRAGLQQESVEAIFEEG